MINIEDFKEDLKEKQAIANKKELTDFGAGYLTAMERYEKLILSGVSNRRELLIDFFRKTSKVQADDKGNMWLVEKCVDEYLKDN